MAGRRQKPLDIEELKKWARAGATTAEIARRLGISVQTLERRLNRPEVRAALTEAQGELFISLRSRQVQLALSGNATMLIWLGKQYLGQKDKLEHSGTGPAGAIQFHDTSAIDLLTRRIDSIVKRRGAQGSTERTE